jgi:hypothetical protein
MLAPGASKQTAPKTGQKHRHKLESVKNWLKHSRLPKIGLLWLASYTALMSFFLTEVNKTSNYLEVFPDSLVLPALMNAFTALWIALIIHFIKRPRYLAGKLFSATILALFMVNYDAKLSFFVEFSRSFLPILPQPDADLPLISLIFIAVLVTLAALVGAAVERLQKKFKPLTSTNLAAAVLIVVGVMSFGQIFKFAQILPSMIEQTSVQAQALGKPGGKAAQDKPDIYYIVLDRYTNSEVLRDQFGFDNSEFTNFLRSSGFYVNDSAYANYPYTTLSLASTLNASYTNQLVAPYKSDAVHSRALYHNLTHYGSVIKALKDVGYEYHSIGNSYDTSNRAPIADHTYVSPSLLTAFGTTKKLHGLEGSAFAQSPYHRFALASAIPDWLVSIRYTGNVDQIREQLNTLDELAGNGKPGGRFIFAHMLLPHEPFEFNADGSLSQHRGYDSYGKPIKEKYIEQVKFTNSQIGEITAKIRKNSPEAVVIINADEGTYPQFINDTFRNPTPRGGEAEIIMNNSENMQEWPVDWLKMKFGILQAVHIPEATREDLNNLSSVNVFRIVLNRYLGYDLEYLPSCQLGTLNGRDRSHYHANVTPQLLGRDASPKCEDYQVLPS